MTYLLLSTWLIPAQVIAPIPYAATYCRLRRSGFPERVALPLATRRAMIPGAPPKYITIFGQRVRFDIFAAQATALEQCPDL